MKKTFLVGWAAALLALVTACQTTEPAAESDAVRGSEPAAVAQELPTAIPNPAPTPTTIPDDFYADWLPVLGEAPEIDNDVWINSDPLTMAELEGKVVLVEFWTFG